MLFREVKDRIGVGFGVGEWCGLRVSSGLVSLCLRVQLSRVKARDETIFCVNFKLKLLICLSLMNYYDDNQDTIVECYFYNTPRRHL